MRIFHLDPVTRRLLSRSVRRVLLLAKLNALEIHLDDLIEQQTTHHLRRGPGKGCTSAFAEVISSMRFSRH